jgi:hypothetical protein
MISTQCTQTDVDLPSTPRNNIRKPLKKIYSRLFRKQPQSKKLIEIHQSYRSHRPYFTYWVTFVQILVCIVSLIVYGHAPLVSTQTVDNHCFVFRGINVFI